MSLQFFPPSPKSYQDIDQLSYSESSIIPKRIILVRHGESIGNEDENTYARIPDWKIELTENGIAQSRRLGLELKSVIGDGTY